MNPFDFFASVASQLLSAGSVHVNGQSFPVKETPHLNLKIVNFAVEGFKFTAIQQNPEAGSVWARSAMNGNKVVQFKDADDKYVAVTINGRLHKY